MSDSRQPIPAGPSHGRPRSTFRAAAFECRRLRKSAKSVLPLRRVDPWHQIVSAANARQPVDRKYHGSLDTRAS